MQYLEEEFNELWAQVRNELGDRWINSKLGNYFAAIHRGLNNYRSRTGAVPLAVIFPLSRIAFDQAVTCEKAAMLTHIGPDGDLVEVRAKRVGYTAAVGEVLTRGRTAVDAFQYLISDGSRAKIVADPQFTAVGIGKSGDYWVCVLGVVKV